MSTRLNYSIDRQLKQRLLDLAALQRRAVSQILDEAVVMYLEVVLKPKAEDTLEGEEDRIGRELDRLLQEEEEIRDKASEQDTKEHRRNAIRSALMEHFTDLCTPYPNWNLIRFKAARDMKLKPEPEWAARLQIKHVRDVDLACLEGRQLRGRQAEIERLSSLLNQLREAQEANLTEANTLPLNNSGCQTESSGIEEGYGSAEINTPIPPYHAAGPGNTGTNKGLTIFH